MIWIIGLIIYLAVLGVFFAPFVLSGRISRHEEKECAASGSPAGTSGVPESLRIRDRAAKAFPGKPAGLLARVKMFLF